MKIVKIIIIIITINDTKCFMNYFINKFNGFKGLNEINKLNDLDNIKYCSKLSRTVYIDNKKITEKKSRTKIKFVEKGRNIYICFEGSTDIKDWKTNFDKSLITNYHNNDIYRIHSGYYNRYISLSSNIYEYLKKKNFEKVYICGHSLGAAMASICCFELVRHNIINRKKIYCITFGSPRIGDKNLSKLYNNLNIKTYRIVLSGDPVPKLPLDENYIHLTSSYYLKNNKIYNKPTKIYIAIKRFIINICYIDYSLKNHTMDRYIETLDLIK